MVFFVYGILIFFAFTAITIVLPFEAAHRHILIIIFLFFFAIYLFINIIYHYRKASTIKPGSPPKVLFYLFVYFIYKMLIHFKFNNFRFHVSLFVDIVIITNHLELIIVLFVIYAF